MHKHFLAALLRLVALFRASARVQRQTATTHQHHTHTPLIRRGMWVWIIALLLSVAAFGGRALAAGDPSGCAQTAPSGWTRTIWWVDGQEWSPSQTGPWANGTTVSVVESNAGGSICTSNGGAGEAYRDGQSWWGTFRQDYRAVGRGDTWEPSYGVKRFARTRWWSGWQRPAIGNQQVAGYWLKSSGPTDGQKSVFVAGDSEVWVEVGAFYVEARCMAPDGPLVPVTFGARNSTGSWSASTGGSSWSVTNAAGPGPWTVSASGYGWSGSASLGNNGTHTFVVTGCGSTPGSVSLEAHCHSVTGPLVNAGAFDAWENTYWSRGGWYASSGYGSTASFSVPAGATTPIGARVWWPDGTSSQTTTSVGSVVRFVTTNPAWCSGQAAPPTGPTPTTPPAPCAGGAGAYDGATLPLTVSGPNVDVQTKYDEPTADGPLFNPPSDWPAPGTVRGNQPIQVTWDFTKLDIRQNYTGPHAGQSAVAFQLVDHTTGQLIVDAHTTDEHLGTGRYIKFDTSNDRMPSTYNNQPVSVSVGGQSSFWRRSHGNWSRPENRPLSNTFLRALGTWTVTFTPIEGHEYRAYAVNAHGPCKTGWPRWGRARFTASSKVGITLLEADMTGRTIRPMSGQSMHWFSYTTGGAGWSPAALTTSAAGAATIDLPPGRMIGVLPGFAGYDPAANAMAGYVLWKVEHTCPHGRVVDSGTYKGFWDIARACNATLFYVQVPAVSVRAVHETDAGQQPLALVAVQLVNSAGAAVVAPTVTNAAGNASFTISEDAARAQIGSASSAWRMIAPETQGILLVNRAVAGTNAQVLAPRQIQLSPVGVSNGNLFIYRTSERTVTFNGLVRLTDGSPIAGARVRVTVQNGAGTTLDAQTLTTTSSGAFSYSKARLLDDQTLSLTAHLESWPDPDHTTYQAYPGTVSPGHAGAVVRVDTQMLRLTLAINTGNVASNTNVFELNETPPPPPKDPGVAWKLFMRSRYDGAVHLSQSDEVTWPQGEVLQWMPQITLDEPPSETINGLTYRYEAEVVAWSFLGSVGKAATGADDSGHTGCRDRHQPSSSDLNGGRADMLDGCVYYYDDTFASRLPSTTELGQQAHAFWAMQQPLDIEPWVYVYQIPQLQRVDLRVQALMRVQTIQLADPVLGTPERPVGDPEYRTIEKDTPFYVNLVTPRSTQ